MNDRIKKHKEIIKNIITELKILNPDIEIVYTKYTEKIIYYTANVINSKIKISKHERTIYIKDNAQKMAKNRFYTRDAAKNAILDLEQRAKLKAINIVEKLNKLQTELNFDIDYTMEGDTYGIYEDHLDINFTIGMFHFNYNIEDIK